MLKVGDGVTIKPVLVDGASYGMDNVSTEMLKYAGQRATIIYMQESLPDVFEYQLDIDGGKHFWSINMFVLDTISQRE